MRSHPQGELLRGFLEELRTHEAGLVLHLARCASCQIEVEAVLAPAEQQGPKAPESFFRSWDSRSSSGSGPENSGSETSARKYPKNFTSNFRLGFPG
jgi:hypothetical protein